MHHTNHHNSGLFSSLLAAIGITPTPRRLLLARIIFVVLAGLLAVWILGEGDDTSKFGNYEQLKAEYPDQFE